MSAPIKIVHVMEAVIGGTQRHLLDLALGLPPDRFEQHLVVSLRRNPDFADYIPRLQAQGVGVIVLPMRRGISPLADYHSLARLVEILMELRPDIVHGHSAKGGFLARLAAHRAGVSHTIYTPHVFPFQMSTSPLQRWLYLALERYAARLTDVIIAVSDSEEQAAIRADLAPPAQVVLIRNGIKAANYGRLQECERRQVRQELGAADDTVLIGAVGDLRPQKSYDILLKATALLPQASAVGAASSPRLHAVADAPKPLSAAVAKATMAKEAWRRREAASAAQARLQIGAKMPLLRYISGRPVRVVIAGEGSLRPTLERMIARLGLSEVVALLGERQDVPQLLGALDLFVMPSRYEGCPYALLEAMAAGVPIVATAVSGITDIIEPYKTGWLATPQDPSDLAGQIAQACSQSDRSGIMAATARRLVEDEYDRDQMLTQTAQLYERCAAGK